MTRGWRSTNINYEPNSAANGALFSLVEGTFAFVAGQVAHTGEGLKINTPIATMGIRGTVGLFRSEPDRHQF